MFCLMVTVRKGGGIVSEFPFVASLCVTNILLQVMRCSCDGCNVMNVMKESKINVSSVEEPECSNFTLIVTHKQTNGAMQP